MSRDPAIAELMWQLIVQTLDSIERQEGVRILLAVESGSRAWRFPSPDSDYDVRFIYAHPPEAYLSIETPSDVIERPVDRDLDISGWDIRKALQLLLRSNATLLEWLHSPVRYRDAGRAPEQLLALARETCHLPALVYHYDRMARRSFDEIEASAEAVRLKAYCYALRPALALRWIGQHSGPPPMDLPRLLDGAPLSDELRQAIATLVEQKAAADERSVSARRPLLDAFIVETLAQRAGRAIVPKRADVLARANALFAAILRPGGHLGP